LEKEGIAGEGKTAVESAIQIFLKYLLDL